MGKKIRRFADDGWALWIDGDERSTIYFNEWINPKGKSYVDVGVRIYGAKGANEVNIYAPFKVSKDEITDLSVKLSVDEILRAVFNANGIVDTEKNEYTSELKYDNRIVSLINLSEKFFKSRDVDKGAVITIELNKIQEYITSDEVYLIFRIPHKSIDDMFSAKINADGMIERFKELVTSPVVTKKYGYSIRVNEARLLPDELNQIEVLQQQRIRKALVTISLDEEYELNDSGCYRIRRLEEDLYKDYAPEGYDCSDAITYQWVEPRDKSMKAHYNFYFDMVCSSISKVSMLVYLIVVLLSGALGSAIYDLIKMLIGFIS